MSEQKSKKTRGRPKSKTTATKKATSENKPKKRLEWKGLVPQLLSKEDKAWVDSNLPLKGKATYDERKRLSEIHAKAFMHKFAIPCTCDPKVYVQWSNELIRLSSES